MKKLLIIGAGLAAIAGMYFYSKYSDGEENMAVPDAEDLLNQATEAAGSVFETENLDDMTKEQNLTAFLRALRYGEGTAGANGYRTKCGGSLFDDYSDHPANLGWRGLPLSDAMCKGAGLGSGCVSTAAGAYQFTKPTWNSLAKSLGLPDFSPESQDRAATELIRQKGALADVYAGRAEVAAGKVRKIWASLPGAGYGQHEVAMGTFLNNYRNEGGVLA